MGDKVIIADTGLAFNENSLGGNEEGGIFYK